MFRFVDLSAQRDGTCFAFRLVIKVQDCIYCTILKKKKKKKNAWYIATEWQKIKIKIKNFKIFF